ncbi:MAG: HD-GYP domain-containing protein [Agathobacter sp.]|nr:HD-GYP domain-containing protein [Agathobacter sp.]MBQ6811787.1 HD-GYP domain-containing protein [Agathobacter sp.]
MRYVKAEHLEKGMVLVYTLYDNNEKVLLKANRKLTQNYINRIQQMDIMGLYVFEDDEITEHTPIVSEQTRLKAIKSLKRLNIDDCIYVANNIVEEIRESESMIVETINLSTYDNYTYTHSVNVDILAVVLGVACGLRDDELRKLSQAALLHDIGKTCVPIEILNKPAPLTEEEWEEMKKHPLYGYNMLKDNYDVSSVTRNAILSHHENVDGSGYPRHLTAENIHLFAKIIHIADVYDALITKRIYKDAMNPADALEYLMGNAEHLFDKELVAIFMDYIAPYPLGVQVELSTGQTALVVKNNRAMLSRPIVRLDGGALIDLMERLDITIIKLLTNLND